MNNFLLIFLIYWECQLAANPSLAGIKSLSKIYELTGLNEAKARLAIEWLEEHRLLRWNQGKYRLDMESLTNVIYRYFDPADIDTRKWCIAEGMCQYLFRSPKTRERTVGKMNYLDKLLMMSLAVTADEDAQIKEFDFSLWASWLEMDQSRLATHLDRLKSANGFILDYPKGYRLSESLYNESTGVTVNPAHPWLHGDPARPELRGNMNFYGYCLMEGKTVHFQAKNTDNKPCLVTYENEEFGFTAFHRDMDFEHYGQYLQHYITALEEKQKQQEAGKAVDRQANVGSDSNKPEEVSGGRKSATRRIAQPSDEVVPQWGANLKQLRLRKAELKQQVYRICFDLTQEVLRGISFSTKTLSLNMATAALETHPLFKGWQFGELPESPELNQENTRVMYLGLLFQGTSYMLDVMVRLVMVALKAHPDQAVTDGECMVRFIHFEVPGHEGRARRQRYEQESCLSGVLFLRVFDTDYQGILVQQTPTLQSFRREPENAWFIEHRKIFASISPYYESCPSAGAALINDWQSLAPSERKRVRKSQELFGDAPAVSWLEYLAQQSQKKSV